MANLNNILIFLLVSLLLNVDVGEHRMKMDMQYILLPKQIPPTMKWGLKSAKRAGKKRLQQEKGI